MYYELRQAIMVSHKTYISFGSLYGGFRELGIYLLIMSYAIVLATLLLIFRIDNTYLFLVLYPSLRFLSWQSTTFTLLLSFATIVITASYRVLKNLYKLSFE